MLIFGAIVFIIALIICVFIPQKTPEMGPFHRIKYGWMHNREDVMEQHTRVRDRNAFIKNYKRQQREQKKLTRIKKK